MAQEMSLTAALRDLNKLNAFVRVAQRRSFTKAAADLHMTPSVVSKYMKELEDSLGFSLINRSTHGIMLTDAGEGLFQNCLQMLAQLDGYVVETRNLQKGPYGTLRVQATSDYAQYVLAPKIPEFVAVRACAFILSLPMTAILPMTDLTSWSQAESHHCPASWDATSARSNTSSVRRRRISSVSAGRRGRRIFASTRVSSTCCRRQKAGRSRVPRGKSSLR
jgi:hypothetical protein